MKICVTSSGQTWAAAANPSFGRAPYFLVVDVETESIDPVKNDPGVHGAGVQAAQTAADRGVAVVVTGSVGPNAFQGLAAAGIEVYIGATGTVREAFDAYRAGKLSRATAPTGSPHRGGRR